MLKALIRPDRDPLVSLVEIDETDVGGIKTGKMGRGATGKAVVMVAVEDISLDGIGRIRLKRVSDASGISLIAFVKSNIAPGAELRTDGWAGYNKLAEQGSSHTVERECEEDEETGEKPLKLCHLVISLFKRHPLVVYQGAVHPEQLGRYLDEFNFVLIGVIRNTECCSFSA